ncbi:MAG: NUDIX domain-containing protein [Prevotella sp.]|nr:NUDIX domain-containing protein [Prevotella sp.]
MKEVHPLNKFNYCPMCGSKHFVVNNFKSKHCEDCGFVFYMNPCAATAAFIINSKGELLVVRRGKEPAKGTLDLPGGFIDNGETAEEGMTREVKEETALDVIECKYLFSMPNIYPYAGIDVHTLDMLFECKVNNEAEARADDDAAELMWIPIEKINPEEFGLASIRNAVEIFSLRK